MWRMAGYIGSLSFLETILRVVEKLRTKNPNLIYGESSQAGVPGGTIL